jgi:hypothetical protein
MTTTTPSSTGEPTTGPAPDDATENATGAATGRTRLADVRSRLPRTVTAGLDGLRDEVGRQLKDPTPAYAALGAGDVVARRVGEVARHGAVLAGRARRDGGVDATHLPRLAVGRALTLAGKVEETYGEMAVRGRAVARRARDGRPAGELVRLALLALDRARPPFGERRPTVVVGETVPTPAAASTGAVVEPVVEPVARPVTDARTTAAKAGTAEPVVPEAPSA